MIKVLLVSPELLVHVEYLVNQVTQVKKVPKVKLVQWVRKEESLVNLDSRDKTDLQVNQVRVAYLVRMENQVNVVPKAIRVTKDQLVHLDFLVLPEPLVNKVDKDHPVLLVRLVRWAQLDCLEKTENLDKMAFLVHPVNLVLMVSQEQVSEVHLVNPELLVLLDWTDHEVSPEHPVDLVKTDEKVKQLLVLLANLVSLVKLVLLENLVSLVRMENQDVMQF